MSLKRPCACFGLRKGAERNMMMRQPSPIYTVQRPSAMQTLTNMAGGVEHLIARRHCRA